MCERHDLGDMPSTLAAVHHHGFRTIFARLAGNPATACFCRTSDIAAGLAFVVTRIADTTVLHQLVRQSEHRSSLRGIGHNTAIPVRRLGAHQAVYELHCKLRKPATGQGQHIAQTLHLSLLLCLRNLLLSVSVCNRSTSKMLLRVFSAP